MEYGTEITTAQIPDKIIAQKDKQIGNIVSAECGTLITVACAVFAIGNQISSFFVFPRVCFKNHFIALGPQLIQQINQDTRNKFSTIFETFS